MVSFGECCVPYIIFELKKLSIPFVSEKTTNKHQN